MEITVVTCEVSETGHADFDEDVYPHIFEFPEEWKTEKRILLTGIWISKVESMGSFNFRYYNLRIDVNYENAFSLDDGNSNQLSKFSVPVVIDKGAFDDMNNNFAEYFGNVRQEELTITYMWRSMPDNIDVDVFAYTLSYDYVYNPQYHTIPFLAKNCTVYLQICTEDNDNDTCNIQPLDSLELREDMTWSMVTPTVIRIDGPSEPFLLNYRHHNTDFDDADIIYKYFVARVEKIIVINSDMEFDEGDD